MDAATAICSRLDVAAHREGAGINGRHVRDAHGARELSVAGAAVIERGGGGDVHKRDHGQAVNGEAQPVGGCLGEPFACVGGGGEGAFEGSTQDHWSH